MLYIPASGEIFLLSINTSEPKLLCVYAFMHVQISVSSTGMFCKNHLLDARVQLREFSTPSSKCCNLSAKRQGGNYKDQVKYLAQPLQTIRLEMFALRVVACWHRVRVIANQSRKNLGSLTPHLLSFAEGKSTPFLFKILMGFCPQKKGERVFDYI